MAMLTLALSMSGMGCGYTPAPATDDKDALAFNGKADSHVTACALDAILVLVNDPGTTEEALKALGVHSRAAHYIAEFRLGEDGVVGTEDDRFILTLQELDAIYYVGPAALEQLVAAVASSCDAATSVGEIDVIFSPQAYQDSHLSTSVQIIDAAAVSVDVAMYSFRDAGILDALDSAVGRGVAVRVIFNQANTDKSDPEGTMSAKLEDAGADVRYINKVMHHKFMLVDGAQMSLDAADTGILVTGSGNWSHSAGTVFDENTLVVEGNARLNLLFQREFNHLWLNSRDLMWNESLAQMMSMPIEDWMIPADESVDALFTSTNFDTYESTAYGPTFTVVHGLSTVADRWVSLIQSAQFSIHIASGHLRSRPIAEALMAKKAANPHMDIRVYLDGQEYTSSWTHDQQQEKLATCVDEAGANAKKVQKCYDVGFLFAYALDTSGVPVRFKHYAYRWHYSYAPQMHHKYMVIDGGTLVTGSYNLSDNAEHNTMENVIVLDGPAYRGLAQAFEANFESMWSTGEAEGLFDQLMAQVQSADTSVPLVYPSMALTTSQVTMLKALIRQICPAVDSWEYRKDPRGHQVCYL